jgi:hypothetical protein
MNHWALAPLILIIPWGIVRKLLAGSTGWFETPSRARNRRMGRTRETGRVRVISLLICLYFAWLIIWGSRGYH